MRTAEGLAESTTGSLSPFGRTRLRVALAMDDATGPAVEVAAIAFWVAVFFFCLFVTV